MRARLRTVLLLAALAFGSLALPARGQGGGTIYLPLLGRATGPAFMVADLTPPGSEEDRFGGVMGARGDTLFFQRGCGELWKAERGAAPLLLRGFPADDVSFCPYLGSAVALGDAAYFVAYGANNAVGLWRSDGTVSGTRQVFTFSPASLTTTRLFVSGLTVVGDSLYLTLGEQDEQGGSTRLLEAALWRSDGTPAGTTRVAALPTGYVGQQAVLGGELFFTLDVGAQELWASDGTAAGTRRVAVTDGIYSLTASAGRLWFASSSAKGYTLWTSDGTPGGTRLLTTFDFTFGPSQFVELGGVTYFSLYHPLTPYYAELWRSDGTAEGTAQIAGVEVNSLTAHNGSLYFVSAQRLYRSDGTSGGTRPVEGSPVAFGPFVGAGGRVYFVGAWGQLWASDGTAAGTRLVQQIGGSSPDSLTRAGDTLYFMADDGVHGRELWALPLGG